jgi:hypothetical protein
MSSSKCKALLLTFPVIITALTITDMFQSLQIAYSQTDYEEYLIINTNNEQGLNQQNIGSGSSANINCGTNTAGTNLVQPTTVICPGVPAETPEPPEPPTSDQEFTTTTVSSTTQMPYPTSRATAEVSCPEGTDVTGGGYELRSETGVEVHQVLNTPEDRPTENGWRTTAQVNAISDEVTLLLTVYAVCGSLADPT